MDEILDMIEQEQMAREGLGPGDEEDDKNIDEILAFINKQQPPPSQQNNHEGGGGLGGSSDQYALPEEAEAEFEAMMQQQQQQQQHQQHFQHQQHQHQQYQHQPYQNQNQFYGNVHQQRVDEDVLAGMSKMNIKGLSATSAPFVPRAPNQ